MRQHLLLDDTRTVFLPPQPPPWHTWDGYSICPNVLTNKCVSIAVGSISQDIESSAERLVSCVTLSDIFKILSSVISNTNWTREVFLNSVSQAENLYWVARDFLHGVSTPGVSEGQLIRCPCNRGCPYMSAGVHLSGVPGSKVSGSGASLVVLVSLGQLPKKWCPTTIFTNMRCSKYDALYLVSPDQGVYRTRPGVPDLILMGKHVLQHRPNDPGSRGGRLHHSQMADGETCHQCPRHHPNASLSHNQ